MCLFLVHSTGKVTDIAFAISGQSFTCLCERSVSMSLSQYGVLKGSPIGHLRDADDDHYQILVKADTTLHRIAVNVLSSAPNSPSIVLFQTTTSLPDAWTADLKGLAAGYQKLPSTPGGLALDYVRSGIVKSKSMTPVPPNAPGVDNDLKDMLEDAVVKALGASGAVIYALGAKWGPETNKKDQYFQFKPGNGIHDIHMNQGNSGSYKKDNGVYQDGALVIEYPGDKWRAFFFAFQSQTFNTDNRGNPVSGGGSPGQPPAPSQPKPKKKPKPQPKKKPQPKPKSGKKKSPHR